MTTEQTQEQPETRHSEVRSDALLAEGMRLYRVEKEVPGRYGWSCKIGDILPFPARDNENGWRDVNEISGCYSSRMWVSALIGDGILVDVEEERKQANDRLHGRGRSDSE